jgi:EmrB/QacA subfamily drug resistance transporter
MTKAQKLTLVATILGSGVVFLDGSIVNLALPAMGKELGVGFAGQQWIVDGYLLSLSSLILLGGSLGDIIGRKKIYIMGLIGFGIASLLCGIAPTAGLLIAARILQGLFGALMVPGALALINTNFEKQTRAGAIGSWTAWTSAIIAVAPFIGGTLIDHGSWRLIFFINLPLLLGCYLLGNHAIKESKDSRVRHVDISGAAMAMVSLAGITYGLIEGPSDHWGAASLLPLIGGSLLFVYFIWFEHHHKDPMLELSLFKVRNFTGANIATFAMYGALGGFFFALVIYLQNKLGYTSLQAGLSSLPITLFLLGLSRRVGAWSANIGPRLFMTFGPILAGIGILLLLPVDKGTSYVTGILPGICLFGLGMASTVAPLTTTVLNSVEMDQSGIASAVNNAVSRVSGLIVIALLGLFGADQAYHFAVLLCGILAVVAGVVSFIFIRNEQVNLKKAVAQTD